CLICIRDNLFLNQKEEHEKKCTSCLCRMDVRFGVQPAECANNQRDTRYRKGQTGPADCGRLGGVQGTSTGTITDLDGKFTLAVPPGTKNIEIRYIGY